MLKIVKESNDPFGILHATENVIKKARFVQVDSSKIDKISTLVDNKLRKELGQIENGLGLTGDYEKDMQLLFIQDAVNFCFWSEKGKDKWSVEWPKGKTISGGWFGLVATFQRALAENIPILDANYLSYLKLDNLKEIFRSANSSEIPLIEKRLKILKETGIILIDKFEGKFINLLAEAKFDAIEVVKLVYDNFPSFRDDADYYGIKIHFLKRAQIVANDLSYIKIFRKNYQIKNMDILTAFADYKLPQILRHFRVINYNENLAKKVDNYKLIRASGPEEIEIRSATIQGIDIIRKNLKKYTASQIDNAIWFISQDQSKIDKPYHRTYTTFY